MATAPRFSLAIVLLLLAPAALPPAAAVAAEVFFFEDWSDGLVGWDVSGSSAFQDCARGAPGCSLALVPTCCGSYVGASKPLDVPVEDVLRFSFDFMGPSIYGNTDMYARIEFTEGGFLLAVLTYGSSPNNGFTFYSDGFGQHNTFATWGKAFTWYGVDVVIDNATRTARMSAYAPDGSVLGTSNALGFPDDATSISRVLLTGINWAGTSQQFNFDNVRLAVPGAPDAPADLVAQPGAGSVALTWSRPVVSDAPVLGYRVYRSEAGGEPALVADTTSTSYEDSGLADDTTYAYGVAAYSQLGEGERAEVVATTWRLPDAPAADAAAGPGVGEITVSWAPPASDGGGDVLSYRVYRVAADGSLTMVAERDGQTRSAAIGGHGNGETASYVVSAVTAVGEGAASAPATATAWDTPGAPVAEAAAGPGVGEIMVSWTPPSYDGGVAIAGYRVYRATADGVPELVAERDAQTRAVVDGALANGETYSYVVAAFNVVGEGAPSTSATATTWDSPEAPDAQVVAGPGLGEITVSWTPPAFDGGSAVQAYRVYRVDADGGFTLLAEQDAANLSFVDGGHGNGETLSYAVTAVNAVGEGEASALANATTFDRPDAPRDLAAEPGPGSVTLTWAPPGDDGGTDVLEYRVYRRVLTESWEYLATITPPGHRTYTDTDVLPLVEYEYAVTAVNLVGEGPLSAPVRAGAG